MKGATTRRGSKRRADTAKAKKPAAKAAPLECDDISHASTLPDPSDGEEDVRDGAQPRDAYDDAAYDVLSQPGRASSSATTSTARRTLFKYANSYVEKLLLQQKCIGTQAPSAAAMLLHGTIIEIARSLEVHQDMLKLVLDKAHEDTPEDLVATRLKSWCAESIEKMMAEMRQLKFYYSLP